MRTPFKSNITAVFGRMNKHPYSNRAIPSCEMARTFSLICDRFDGNSSADVLEKSTSDWIRRGKPARKNMYYHYSSFVNQNSRLDLLQAWSQIAEALTFRQLSLVGQFIAVFSFLGRFFRFLEVVHGHFHGLGLFIPKIITPRKMLAWWLIADQLSSHF